MHTTATMFDLNDSIGHNLIKSNTELNLPPFNPSLTRPIISSKVLSPAIDRREIRSQENLDLDKKMEQEKMVLNMQQIN